LEALRGVGGIILNAEGKRFCNELGRPGLSAIEAGQK
jgi:succinate dehydrogenase/fumarate reductase flavoprotein subunit